MKTQEKNLFQELYDINVVDKVEQKNGLNYLSWAYAWAEVKKRDENADYTILCYDGKPYLYDEKLGYIVFTTVTIFGKTHQMWLPVMDGANKTMLDHSYTYEVNKYEYNKETKKREAVGKEQKTVESATMFDINKTLMRCLVKNIAMFGLGLALYTGEDLPEQQIETKEEAEKYTLNFGKHTGKTLKEILEVDAKYIDWLFNNEKTDEIIKHCITLITGQVQLTEEDKTEKLLLISKLTSLVEDTGTDYEKLLAFYKVKSNADMTLEQLKNAIETLEKRSQK